MPGALFDTNAWVAMVFTSHPAHSVAQNALMKATRNTPALFCRSTQLSFLRLASTPLLHKTYGAAGLTNNDALIALDALLALPQVRVADEPPGTYAQWRAFADMSTASPKVWMDAYLAAFAVTGGWRIVTFDGDFRAYTSQGLILELLKA